MAAGGRRYTPLTDGRARAQLADQLRRRHRRSSTPVAGRRPTPPTQLGNGAKELLDEVATGKVTGEEEIWSHTDLWDFQANVDGARQAFEDLAPGRRRSRTPSSPTTLDERFADAAGAARPAPRRATASCSTPSSRAEQVKELSDAVDAPQRAAVAADRGRRAC